MTGGAEVLVVGGGIEGLSIAWALTCQGVNDVLVLERSMLASAGTGKSSGIVRCHYGVPSLAAMAWRGVALFEQALEVLGSPIGFEQIGYVVGVGARNVQPFEASIAAQQELGVDTQIIAADRVAELCPQIDLDDFAAFAYEPRGGYGDAYSTAMAYADAARRGGATIKQSCAVSDLLADHGRIVGVRTKAGEVIGADAVVVAAGPWSPALLTPIGIDLPIAVHREPILLVDPGESPLDVPVFSDLVLLHYVRPERSGALLLGNSDLGVLSPADPDRYSNTADDDTIERAIGKFARRFPGLEPALVSTYAGCYDVTPDFNPVMSPTPVDGLFVAAGFSGHGFKISAAVGELMADLVTVGHSRAPNIPERDFRLDRFAADDLLLSPHPYVGAGQMR